MERQANGNGTNGRDGPRIIPLEIGTLNDIDEQESLIFETSDDTGDSLFHGRDASGMRKRAGDGIFHADGSGDGSGSSVLSRGTALFQGLVRADLIGHAVYHLRNALLLTVLAFFVLVLLEWEDGLVVNEQMEKVEPPHDFSFGGKHNVAQSNNDNYFNIDDNYDDDYDYNYGDDYGNGNGYSAPKRQKTIEEEMQDLEEEILNDAFDKTGSWDLDIENEKNEEGHYLHDSEISPFASGLYQAEQNILDERQREFMAKMDTTINEYGLWNNPSFDGMSHLSEAFYDTFTFRDVPVEDFPPTSWQKDTVYLEGYLDQAAALVEAATEGIMREYNHMNPGDEEKALFNVIIGEKTFVNGTAMDKGRQGSFKESPGVAYLPQASWDGLVKKLLHAMITTDIFYVAVVGTEEAYAGNNFGRTQVMHFNYVMEPIFHKLGMTLISRNMGTSISPLVSALGGADILGETDILWHVQKHESEEELGEFDLLQKQVIMSGERIPIIFSPKWDDLMAASKGEAWVGNLQPGTDVCQLTTADVLPTAPACHGVNCDADAWEKGSCHVYDSVCWTPRSDFTPMMPQDNDVGLQNKQYPGHRRHQLEGRKMSLVVLHALAAALDLWQEKLKDDKNPLPLADEFWHVGDTYMRIRKTVMGTDRTPGEVAEVPACEMFLQALDPRICHIPMRAFTEWTPRVIPRTFGLLTIVNNMVDGVSEADGVDAYYGPDILPPSWKLPEDEFDVHMVTIAANVSSGYDDDIFEDLEFTDDDFHHDGYFIRKLQKAKRATRTVRSRQLRGQQIRAKAAPQLRNLGMEMSQATPAPQPMNKGMNQATPAPQPMNMGMNQATPAPKQINQMNQATPAQKQVNQLNQEPPASQQMNQATPAPQQMNQENAAPQQMNQMNQADPAPQQINQVTEPESFTGKKLQISEGSGWSIQDVPIGFCDGSAQSRCNRRSDNSCFLSNSNHYRGHLFGTPVNGWLTMDIRHAPHRIILARIEISPPWRNVPQDFMFDYAVNNAVVSLTLREFRSFGQTLVSGLTVYPLLLDENADPDPDADETPFTIAMRIRSASTPEVTLRLSHIYYA